MRRLQINGQRLELARESNKPVLDVSADGKLYAELTEPTLLQIVESASGKVVGSSRLVGGDGEFELAKFSPDGTLLLVRKAQAATTLVYGPSNLDPPNSMYPQGWTTLAELPFQMVANSTVIATDNSFLFGIDDRVRRIEDGAVEGALLGKWEVQPKPRRIEGGWDPPFWFETHDVVHAYGRAELNKGGAWRLDFASLKAALEDGTIEEAVASGRVVGVLRRGTRRTGSRAPTLELIDIGTGASRALVALEGREGSGLVGVTPDGALAILEHGEVVDSATGKLLRKLEIPADMFISHTACAPDGWAVLEVWQPVKERSKLLAGELRTGKLKSLDLPYGALSMSMDASGLRVAVPVGKNVLVFDARTLRAVGEPLGHSVDIVDIAFSQDGAELAAGDEWRGIWLWDMREQQRYRTALRGSEGELLFSPDRRMLFSAGNEGAVLWDLDPEGYRQRALEQANRPLTRAERDHYMGWERGPAGGEAGNRMDGGEGLRRASGSH
jgi:hypothetical protein